MKNASEYQTIEHCFEPIFNSQSQILILGSLPSVKSRENNFYYGHPQNRFWKLIATLCRAEVPQTIDEKKKLLYDHKIAVWDVIAKCDIIGSADSTIKNVVPNKMQIILEHSSINRIFANGGKAYELYMRYCYPDCKREITKLPSTSPANAAFSWERLLLAWSDAILLKREKLLSDEVKNDLKEFYQLHKI